MFIFLVIYVFMATIVIQYESIYSGDETSITGSIMSYSINGNKLKMNIKDKEEVIATYYIKTEEELVYLKENIGIGKTITVNGTLNEPINNTIPNTFNYKKYLYIYGSDGLLKDEYREKLYSKIRVLEEKYNITYKTKEELNTEDSIYNRYKNKVSEKEPSLF